MGCIVINFRTRQIIIKDDENKPDTDAPKVTLTVPDTSKLKESRKEQNDRIIQKLQLQKGK